MPGTTLQNRVAASERPSAPVVTQLSRLYSAWLFGTYSRKKIARGPAPAK
jgi:hypothetical protein